MLSQFKFERVIGKGGMGVVWLASHRADGTQVAVKFLKVQTDGELLGSELTTELKAVARLHHQGIVALLNAGMVSEEEAAQAPVGSRTPYLVYEYVDGQTLGETLGKLAWNEARAVVLELLDALGHAHARKVIHRDLKPDNILIGDGQPRIADFGIARCYFQDERAYQTHTSAPGTIRYMSPEQLRGEQRNQTAATDLYALGCVAFALFTGEPAFPRELTACATRKFSGEFPDIRDYGGTDDLAVWLETMLAPDWRDRFACAADAATAFAAIPGQLMGSVGEVLPETLPMTEGFATVSNIAERRERTTDVHASIPSTWRQRFRVRALPTGMGAGIFQHREPPFAGRHEERDRLWEALQSLVEDGGTRYLAITGPPGLGKTRLAKWLQCRAYEVGAAFSIDFVVDSDGDPLEVIAHGLARHLGLVGLDRDSARQRLIEAFSQGDHDQHEDLWIETDATLLAGIVSDNTQDSNQTPVAINEVFRRVIDRLAARRPLVVLVDGVEKNSWWETLLAEIEVTGSLRALLLSTGFDSSREDALKLSPMTEEELSKMLGGLIGLEPPTARLVIESCGGNPLFAAQIVEDWLQREALERGENGLKAAPDATVPVTVTTAFENRLRGTLASKSSDARDAAAILAALGADTSVERWTTACEHAEVHHDDILDSLAVGGLIRVREGLVRFDHPILPELLLENARERGRSEAVHLACARVLHSEGRLTDTKRCARHFIEARRWREARDLLRRNIWALMQSGFYDQALELLDPLEECATQISELASERTALFREIVHAWRDLRQGAVVPDSLKRNDLAERARSLGDLRLLGDVKMVLGFVARDVNRVDCYDYFAEGTRLYQRASAEYDEWRARNLTGWMAGQIGRYDEALATMSECITHFDEVDDTGLLARAYHGRSFVRLQLGNIEGAKEDCRAALGLAQSQKHPATIAACHMDMGEILRFEVDLDQAYQFYQRSLEINLQLAQSAAMSSRINIAMTVLGLGDVRELEDCLHELSELRNSPRLGTYLSLLETGLHCLKSCEDDARRIAQTIEFDLVDLDRDHAWMLEIIAHGSHGEVSDWAQTHADQIWRDLKLHRLAEVVKKGLASRP